MPCETQGWKVILSSWVAPGPPTPLPNLLPPVYPPHWGAALGRIHTSVRAGDLTSCFPLPQVH